MYVGVVHLRWGAGHCIGWFLSWVVGSCFTLCESDDAVQALFEGIAGSFGVIKNVVGVIGGEVADFLGQFDGILGDRCDLLQRVGFLGLGNELFEFLDDLLGRLIEVGLIEVEVLESAVWEGEGDGELVVVEGDAVSCVDGCSKDWLRS